MLVFFLFPCLNAGWVWAGEWKYIASSKPGHLYLAGSAPKLLKVTPAGKIYFRSKDKKYCQKYYITYQRSNRDQGDRTYPVIKARRWEDIIAWIDSRKLYKKFPLYELFHFWNKHMPDTTTWKRPFPTLKAIITYKVANEVGLPGLGNQRINHYPPKKKTVWVKEWVWHSKWWITGEYQKVAKRKWVSPPPLRRAIGKTKIKEELVYALPPGRHRLEIRAKADIDHDHPLVRFKQIYSWKKYAKSPIEIIVDKITRYISVKQLFKKAVAAHAQNTVSVYYLEIPAITPDLRGKHKKEAYQRLKKWSLKPKFKMAWTNNKKQHNRVRSQKPAPGTLLKAGTTVLFTYWVYNKTEKGTGSNSIDITGAWGLPGYKVNISGSKESYIYTGEEDAPIKPASRRFKHQGTLTFNQKEGLYHGDVKDMAGSCCTNYGTMKLKIINKNMIQVWSSWKNPPINPGWKTLRRLSSKPQKPQKPQQPHQPSKPPPPKWDPGTISG